MEVVCAISLNRRADEPLSLDVDPMKIKEGLEAIV
jgi:hypothetical protein